MAMQCMRLIDLSAEPWFNRDHHPNRDDAELKSWFVSIHNSSRRYESPDGNDLEGIGETKDLVKQGSGKKQLRLFLP